MERRNWIQLRGHEPQRARRDTGENTGAKAGYSPTVNAALKGRSSTCHFKIVVQEALLRSRDLLQIAGCFPGYEFEVLSASVLH